MNGFVTDYRLGRVVNIPIAVPQTEVRAGYNFVVGSFNLKAGQRVEIRSLTLKVVQILTVGALPDLSYSAYGLALVGVFSGLSDATPLVYSKCVSSSPRTSNPFSVKTIHGPGEYRILVKNCTSNLDLSLCATGSIKLYT